MPRVNSGRKQKDDLKNFVPEGFPSVGPFMTGEDKGLHLERSPSAGRLLE